MPKTMEILLGIRRREKGKANFYMIVKDVMEDQSLYRNLLMMNLMKFKINKMMMDSSCFFIIVKELSASFL